MTIYGCGVWCLLLGWAVLSPVTILLGILLIAVARLRRV